MCICIQLFKNNIHLSSHVCPSHRRKKGHVKEWTWRGFRITNVVGEVGF
jgi:hypothetical protein